MRPHDPLPPLSVEALQTPALLVRLDRVRANVARMLELVGGRPARWRPHVKTAKIPEVFDLLLAEGLRRFKCATTREAHVVLTRAAVPIDLLVAMPLRGTNLERTAALADAHSRHRVSMLVEDPEQAREARRHPALGLYVDLNSGFDRTGIRYEEHDRIVATAEAAGPALRGLHEYEGHVRAPESAVRAAECRRIFDNLVRLAEELGRLGHPVRELLTSGTPTFAHALDFEELSAHDHQVCPGTVVYWDGISDRFGLTGFAPAATVLTRVVSTPAAGRVTCDAGSKAIDAAAGEPCATVVGWPGLRARRPSEEHLPLDVVHGMPPRPGTLLELVPAHVCPTVNLADEAVLLEGDDIVGIVAVAARGHEIAPGGVRS